MSKYKLDVTKIHCKKKVKFEFGGDEIYFVLVPVLGKFSSDEKKLEGKILKGMVSGIHGGVRSGDAWRPESKDHLIIDAGESDVLSVRVMLFEKDNGKTLKEIKSQIAKGKWPHVFHKEIDWKGIAEQLKKELPEVIKNGLKNLSITVILDLASYLIRGAYRIIEEFRQDDYIRKCDIVYKLDQDNISLPREKRFQGQGGLYYMSFALSKVS